MNSGPIPILFLIESLTVGGAEQVLIDTALGLDRNKWSPQVCCLRGPGEFAYKLDGSGIPLHVLDKKLGVDLSIIGKIREVIRSVKPRIFHSHLFTGNFWGRLAAWQEKVPVILATEHSVDRWKDWKRRMLDRWLARRCTRVLAVSKQVADFYAGEVGIDPEKLELVYNGISPMPAKKPPEAFGKNEGEFVVGTIGRLTEAKDFENWVEALALLRDGGVLPKDKIRGCIVGGGEMEADLRNWIAKRGLGNTIFLAGHQPDARQWLHVFDVFLLSSSREGFPLVLLEAGAAGIPVLSTEVGGVAEIIESEKSGLLVPPKNPKALSEALARLIREPNLRQSIARSLKARVEKDFTLSSMIQRLEALYLRELEGARN